ncbi:unnamed protein product [Ranitomeya imitator]|uniref:Reverse transcriptase domain-containing protein n=1 Tax=Ranitomeya imitator TaxID=111125 RepID=A0ABN9MFE2_9NEOB|nr:unnamed protein product [Ranitomeya imitator]
MEICVQGLFGTGKGKSNPLAREQQGLARAQVPQDCPKERTSRDKEGHQMDLATKSLRELIDLKEKITTAEQQLVDTIKPEDFKTLKTKLDSTITEFRNNLQEKKRTKFLRDADDYKYNSVYRWRFTGPYRGSRPYRRNNNSFSTSSDSDFGTSRPPFLEQRRARPQRGRRGEEGGNTDRQRMTTRSQVDQELHRFFRTLRLKAHFADRSHDQAVEPPVTPTCFSLKSLGLRVGSTFQPPRTYHPVETFISIVQKDVTSILDSIEKGHMKIRNNLSQEEYKSLLEIKNNKDLIIKPADKGGAIVVLDRSYYMEEIRMQLRDNTTYTPIPYNPTFEITKQIQRVVTHYQGLGIIDSRLGDFLINRHPVTPVFYTLPKVHKDLWKPPGRPIVASTNSLLSPLAITLEKILSPTVPNMRSFTKDTAHFLKDGNQGKHRVTKRGPALSYPMFTLVTSEDIAGSRYIDDVFLIWTGDVETLIGFHYDLNLCTSNIEFSIQYDHGSINFLDTLVLIKPGGLVETDLTRRKSGEMADKITPSLRIPAGSGTPGESGTKLLNRASAFTFLDPGRYETTKSKREKKSDHRACLGFNRLADSR